MNTFDDGEPATIPGLLATAARRHEDVVALVDGAASWTYPHLA